MDDKALLDRLRAFLERATREGYENERLTAATKARALLQQTGHTWDDFHLIRLSQNVEFRRSIVQWKREIAVRDQRIAVQCQQLADRAAQIGKLQRKVGNKLQPEKQRRRSKRHRQDNATVVLDSADPPMAEASIPVSSSGKPWPAEWVNALTELLQSEAMFSFQEIAALMNVQYPDAHFSKDSINMKTKKLYRKGIILRDERRTPQRRIRPNPEAHRDFV